MNEDRACGAGAAAAACDDPAAPRRAFIDAAIIPMYVAIWNSMNSGTDTNRQFASSLGTTKCRLVTVTRQRSLW